VREPPWRDYGDHTLARQVYAGLSEAATMRLTEVDYSKAEKACPQGLAIADLMGEVSRLLA
jgi:predicted aldo/keto reductase-like oxidoreductase